MATRNRQGGFWLTCYNVSRPHFPAPNPFRARLLLPLVSPPTHLASWRWSLHVLSTFACSLRWRITFCSEARILLSDLHCFTFTLAHAPTSTDDERPPNETADLRTTPSPPSSWWWRRTSLPRFVVSAPLLLPSLSSIAAWVTWLPVCLPARQVQTRKRKT